MKTSEVSTGTLLPLPPDFNPKTFMLANETENCLFHESRRAPAFAENMEVE